MRLLDRLRAGLRRTAAELGERLDGIVHAGRGEAARSTGRETIEALEEALLQADVGVAATERITAGLGRLPAAPGTPGLQELVKQEILRILSETRPVAVSAASPQVVLVVGRQRLRQDDDGREAGASAAAGRAPAAHLCRRHLQGGRRGPAPGVGGTRRRRSGARAREGGDPAAVVFDAIQAGRARDRDVVLVDTAGRLHTRADLMAELDKMRRVASRAVAGAPHEVLLVLDATVGQNGLVQARQFLDRAGVTGIVLTKIDGTAKGGIAVAVASELGLPIRYVGVGETLDDLLPFAADAYVEALFATRW